MEDIACNCVAAGKACSMHNCTCPREGPSCTIYCKCDAGIHCYYGNDVEDGEDEYHKTGVEKEQAVDVDEVYEGE